MHRNLILFVFVLAILLVAFCGCAKNPNQIPSTLLGFQGAPTSSTSTPVNGPTIQKAVNKVFGVVFLFVLALELIFFFTSDTLAKWVKRIFNLVIIIVCICAGVWFIMLA